MTIYGSGQKASSPPGGQKFPLLCRGYGTAPSLLDLAGPCARPFFVPILLSQLQASGGVKRQCPGDDEGDPIGQQDGFSHAPWLGPRPRP